jgi:uncharacterized protein YjbI with pentapeptide repeats
MPSPFDANALTEIWKAHDRFAMGLKGGRRCIMRYMNLTQIDMSNRNLTEADFTGADFHRTTMLGVVLDRAALYCASLKEVDARYSHLRRADLRGACFRGANFSFAELDGADLRAGTVAISDRDGNFKLRQQRASQGPRPVSFAGGSLEETKLENADAPEVDFTNCNMKAVNFGGANLKGANFSGAVLHGASFLNANLAGANFKRAVLTGVKLKDMQISSAQLKDCLLEPGPETIAKIPEILARIDGAILWVETKGKRGSKGIFDGEDLRSVQKNFKGKALSAISAKDAIAVGVDFSGCELQGAHFDEADLRDATFDNADLRGACFKGANLTHTKFRNCNLQSLPLNSGESIKTAFDGAVLAQTSFRDALCEDDLREAVSGLGATFDI